MSARLSPTTSACTIFCIECASPINTPPTVAFSKNRRSSLISGRSPMNKARPVEKTLWKAPKRGTVKINFDGSFQVSPVVGGFGAVARENDGQVLGAMAGPLLGVGDSFEAEALAAVKAMEWSRDMGFKDIVIEGDALTIIQKVNSLALDFSPIGPYIADLKLLCSFFNTCNFSHVKRDGNAVANCLAKFGSSLSADMFLDGGSSACGDGCSIN
ncbi:hypothetical protein COLO4_20671 [Corchorus olitorius]|uniref:RNase H type-1 domain-containing protein n=1 Tax=Corchorus olitorius TaxID=93759 RepID=A0A1R3IXS8_9ROSI|nr:hypothetical protein COLO4_20671 [Corchorus olitorius]